MKHSLLEGASLRLEEGNKTHKAQKVPRTYKTQKTPVNVT